MNTDSYHMIGLMSGTSGDGLDVAYCHFEKNENWNFEIIRTHTYPFPEVLGNRLQRSHTLSGLELHLLDVEFGKWMGEVVHAFCKEAQIHPDAVCSHGHTVFHQPQHGLSLQIGNGYALHQASRLKVINDFRMMDVQLGGQGAPLVPIGDKLLFSEIDYCLNLGGIANISMEHQDQRIAFDCCPFNLLLNPIAQELGQPFDRDGVWAKEGSINPDLLAQLNQLPFYQIQGAKSLGREDMENTFEPLLAASSASPKDKLASLVEHYAIQISNIIKNYSNTASPSVLITGGGAYHQYFIERLDFHLSSQWNQYEASQELIEFKEALIFGFLGVLKLRGEVNCLASVTHAKMDSCGGTIYS
ncbi:anhydro-N-acetylmuramic acid kinase [Algoriphagus machipongonensis]|uniref:Anhydro-N-acetylmuramic acid kinase n=1 Tax=Algoriphagus machipongonensis TaxID=388413 RepID=A3HU51_9BACT|nr:anhydro-N-acetylmuramic acid kinase [Algoriphagus machipongonensis]EAZ81673.2 anhydro-N-acetylmuramic acid kinase [Algoriphagus machipongonensis]